MKIDNVRQIIVINGYPQSGKDTFVKFVGMHVPTTQIVTSDPAKRALKELGWDGEDKYKVRNLLADLKRISVDNFDGSYKHILLELMNIAFYYAKRNWVVFIHSREPKEIDKLKKELGAKTLFINRPTKEIPNNDSDRNVENYKYDLIIDNLGTLEEFKERAEAFVEYYIEGGLW